MFWHLFVTEVYATFFCICLGWGDFGDNWKDIIAKTLVLHILSFLSRHVLVIFYSTKVEYKLDATGIFQFVYPS